MPGIVPSTAEISLDFKDVPAMEALRYCAKMSGGQLHAKGDILFTVEKGPLETNK
jgi:hypothetical protein